MDNFEKVQFVELFEKVKNLKTAKCRLRHERVQIDAESNLPVTRHIPETVFDRIGLCTWEIRNERVSCGHTTAHLVLLDAIEILESENRIKEDLRADLDSVLNQIYQLDHKKGDAEKDLAMAIEKRETGADNGFDKTLETAAAAIDEIESQHDECVEGIGKVQARIIDEMQKLIDLF